MKKRLISFLLTIALIVGGIMIPSMSSEAAWKSNSTGWWWQENDGTYPKNAWKNIDGKWYYFNGSGYMTTGWQKVDGNWYYMYSNGAMARNTWVGDYYVGADGKWIPGKYKEGWVQTNGRWWYRHADGGYTRNGWEKINNIWYYFDNSGYMTTGWQKVNSNWYYMNGNGAMQSNTWIGNYYVGSNGSMVQNKWIGDYHVGESGEKDDFCHHRWTDDTTTYDRIEEHVWGCNMCGYPLFTRNENGIELLENLYVHPLYHGNKENEDCSGSGYHNEMYGKGFCGFCGEAVEYRECQWKGYGPKCSTNTTEKYSKVKHEEFPYSDGTIGHLYTMYYQDCSCGKNTIFVDQEGNGLIFTGKKSCFYCSVKQEEVIL